MDTNTITNEQLEQVKQLAALFFTPSQIRMMLALPVNFSKRCILEGTAEYQAFQSGWLQEEMLQRQSVLTLAKQGSSPAQQIARQYIQDANAKMMDL